MLERINDSGACLENQKIEIARIVYEHYIYEIIIVLGCFLRWSNILRNSEALAKWVLGRDFSKASCDSLDKDLREDILQELIMFIEQSFVNVTTIKASIRTLLRGTQFRKESLLLLVSDIFRDHPEQDSAVNTLRDDLLVEGYELGYPIPAIPLFNKSQLFVLGVNEKDIKSYSISETIMRLTSSLNQGELVLNKKDLQVDIYASICKNLDSNNYSINKDKLALLIDEGIRMGGLIFGITALNGGHYVDSVGIEVLDLRKSRT